MTTAFTDITALEPGQTLHVAVDAGSWVRVVEGKVQVLSPPAWLGETAVFKAQATLRAEDVHVVERGGWIEVVAHTAARVQVLPAVVRAAHGARLGRWGRFLTGRLSVLRIR
jgi:hypothetical protein